MEEWEFEDEILVEASRREIFDYLAIPEKLVTFWPGVERIWDVKRESGGECRFKWESRRVDGTLIHGTARDTEFVRDEVLTTHGTGDAEAQVTCRLSEVGPDIRVSIEMRLMETSDVPEALMKSHLREALVNLKMEVELERAERTHVGIERRRNWRYWCKHLTSFFQEYGWMPFLFFFCGVGVPVLFPLAAFVLEKLWGPGWGQWCNPLDILETSLLFFALSYLSEARLRTLRHQSGDEDA
jgi:hypothetical protein